MTELKPKGVRNWKHGAYARDKHLYSLWSTMLRRCEDEKRLKYPNYGGRGIKVCDEWHDPNIFMDWAIKNGYKKGRQIDRIDVDGNYEPANCRWVTPKINSRNRRNSKFITINGTTKTVAEWCEVINISQFIIYWWISKRGREYAEKRLAKLA